MSKNYDELREAVLWERECENLLFHVRNKPELVAIRIAARFRVDQLCLSEDDFHFDEKIS
jgi:hypothetical protein